MRKLLIGFLLASVPALASAQSFTPVSPYSLKQAFGVPGYVAGVDAQGNLQPPSSTVRGGVTSVTGSNQVITGITTAGAPTTAQFIGTTAGTARDAAAAISAETTNATNIAAVTVTANAAVPSSTVNAANGVMGLDASGLALPSHLPAATASALGAITCSTGITCSGGAASVAYGTTAGTALEGNLIGTSGATIPLLSTANTWTTDQQIRGWGYFQKQATGVYPANPISGGLAIGWNFNTGVGETDFFNTDSTAALSYAWYQQTGASAATKLMTLGSDGLNLFEVLNSSQATSTFGQGGWVRINRTVNWSGGAFQQLFDAVDVEDTSGPTVTSLESAILTDATCQGTGTPGAQSEQACLGIYARGFRTLGDTGNVWGGVFVADDGATTPNNNLLAAAEFDIQNASTDPLNKAEGILIEVQPHGSNGSSVVHEVGSAIEMRSGTNPIASSPFNLATVGISCLLNTGACFDSTGALSLTGGAAVGFRMAAGQFFSLTADDTHQISYASGSGLEYLVSGTPKVSISDAGALTAASYLVGPSGPTITTSTTAPTATAPAGSIDINTAGASGSHIYVSQGGGTWTAIPGV